MYYSITGITGALLVRIYSLQNSNAKLILVFYHFQGKYFCSGSLDQIQILNGTEAKKTIPSYLPLCHPVFCYLVLPVKPF